MKSRQRREIYNSNGTPERSLVSGLYRRVYAAPRSRGPRLEPKND